MRYAVNYTDPVAGQRELQSLKQVALSSCKKDVERIQTLFADIEEFGLGKRTEVTASTSYRWEKLDGYQIYRCKAYGKSRVMYRFYFLELVCSDVLTVYYLLYAHIKKTEAEAKEVKELVRRRAKSLVEGWTS